MASEPAFAIWITGLPASGKSTITRHLKEQLAARGIRAAILESDELRRVLTPNAAYDEAERDRFYQAMIGIGSLLVNQELPVIFDATANRRAWRDQARETIAQFIEVYVECPLDVCMARDPKGIYRRGGEGAGTVPGLHEPYEQPKNPEIIVHCTSEDPQHAAARIVLKLTDLGFIR